MVTEIYEQTDIGMRRELNEDSCRVCGFEDGGDSGFCILADGMGGHNAGEVASGMAVDIISGELNKLPKDSDIDTVTANIAEAIDFANAKIYEMSLKNPEQSGMGTTTVIVYSCGGRICIANIGDSRAYLIHNGEMTRITHDHSVVQTLVENGDITAEEARTHPNRNLITRALGPDETTLCDAFDVSFAHGDKILLCTDGLVVTATDEEICRIVCADKRAEEKLDDLIALAKAQGAPDNVTAVLVEHE